MLEVPGTTPAGLLTSFCVFPRPDRTRGGSTSAGERALTVTRAVRPHEVLSRVEGPLDDPSGLVTSDALTQPGNTVMLTFDELRVHQETTSAPVIPPASG